MLNKKQSIYETRWFHSEMQKNVEKKLNQTIIDLNKGEKNMICATQWSLDDLNKLTSNRFKTIQELEVLFEHKFTSEELQEKKSKVISLFKDEKATSSSKGGKSCSLTDADFRILYEDRNLKTKDFKRKHPEILDRIKLFTLIWYRGCIRAELKGIQTCLSAHFYNLLRCWHSLSLGVDVPKRGSAGIYANVASRKKVQKNSVKNATYKKQGTNFVAVSESDQSNADSETKEIISVSKVEPMKEPEVAYKPDQEKYGLFIGNELKLTGDSLAHIEGAEMVYKQLGFSAVQRVKILIQYL